MTIASYVTTRGSVFYSYSIWMKDHRDPHWSISFYIFHDQLHRAITCIHTICIVIKWKYLICLKSHYIYGYSKCTHTHMCAHPHTPTYHKSKSFSITMHCQYHSWPRSLGRNSSQVIAIHTNSTSKTNDCLLQNYLLNNMIYQY